MSKVSKARYTAIGYAVSKLVLPVVKKKAVARGRAAAGGTKAKVGTGIGVALGAALYVVTRGRGRDD